MTLVLRKSSPNHRLRSPEDDIVIAADPATNRVLHYQRISNERKVHLPMVRFKCAFSRVVVPTDASACHISCDCDQSFYASSMTR